MNEHCPVCGLRFAKDPGFFDGSMYISYAMIVALLISVFVIMHVIYERPSAGQMTGWVIAIVLLTFPLIWRYSRILYLWLVGGYKYDPSHRKSGDSR